MRSYALLALAAGARLAAAHSTVYAIFVNDVDQGLGNSAAGYVRSPPNNDPLKDVTSASMTCNVNNVATAKTVEVKSGDKVTFEWHHNSRDASDDIIDPSHKGPVLTYIAPTKSNGAGNVWVKLAEDGYDASTKKWAVDTLIANKGKHSITIPDLAAGEYLLRPEIIALHEGDRANGAQFYMECVQIKVTSAGAKTLPAGVAIPGTYTATDPGILFNLYGAFTSYTIPGPKVWDGASGGAAPVVSSAAPVVTSKAAVVTSAPVVVATSAKPVVTSAKPVVTSAKPVVTSAKPAVTSAPVVVKTTLVTLVRSSTKAVTVIATPTSAPATGGSALKYAQCGGIGFTGATTCESGWTCKVQNPYYSQCVSA